MKARFSQQMTGNRKAVMEAISGIVHTEVTYTKAPRFAYETGDWSMDREGVLTSPIIGMEGGEPLFHADLMGALGKQGFAAEGLLTITLFPDCFNAGHLGNIRAILAAKGALLRHALGVEVQPDALSTSGESAPESGLDGGYVFPFFPASTTFPGILSALQLAERIAVQAAGQKRVTVKERPVENEKYAVRCFLIRVGMIGQEYATARKKLLSRLSGDGSFKNSSRPATQDNP